MTFGRDTRIKLIGATVQFRFESQDGVDFVQKLEHYRTQSRDFSPVFDEYGDFMLAAIRKTFQLEGRPKRWAALKEGTKKARVRKGYGESPILVNTGTLKRGFKTEYGSQSLRIFNRSIYFAYHQYGTPNLPKRPMLILLQGHRARFTELARKHLGIE